MQRVLGQSSIHGSVSTKRTPLALRLLLLNLAVFSLSSVAHAQGTAGSVVSADAGDVVGQLAKSAEVDDLKNMTLSDDFSDAPGTDLGLGWTLLRTLAVLGVVVALAYLTLNVGLRKLMGIESVGRRGKPIVKVLERTALDQKRSLFVVRAGDEVLLLGGSESNLSLLSKLDASVVESLQNTPDVAPAERVRLSPLLARLIRRKGP